MSKKSNNELIGRKPFDLQEAVVLLDVYLSFNKKGSSNVEAAEVASRRLRKLARDRGMIIDAAFRSIVGIQNRLRSIGSMYEGNESMSTPGTQVFREAIELYRNNIYKYQNLLAETTNNEEIIDNKPEKVKVSGHKTLDIVVHEDWIHYDFTNSSQFERTIPVYCSIKNRELVGENWTRILVGIVEQEIEKKNPALKPLYKQSLRSSKNGRPFFLKEKIYGLNCSKLSNGYWINVNYSIPYMMDQIQALCLQCGYSKNDIVIYGMPKYNGVKKMDTIPTYKNNKNGVNFEKAEAYLKSMGLQGATAQGLINTIQIEASVYQMKNVLNENDHIIEMPGNRYVHIDAFVDLDEAKAEMNRILKTHFAQFGGYSNNKLLFGAASHDLSMFLNDNNCENIDSVYALSQFFFGKKNADEKYKFSYPHIFEREPEYPMTLKGLMINLARKNYGVLNSDDAKDYLQKAMLSYGSIGQLLQISSSGTFVLYDTDQYLLTEKIGIDRGWIQIVHDRLDNLFRQANIAYVIPRDIKDIWMNTLPPLPQTLHWTVLLLQEVLRNFPDIGFRPITAELSQSRSTIAAAIVPVDSPLQSFSDVVTLYMQDKHILPKRMACEELRKELREAGMLEGNELLYTLPKALDDYRFSWTDENKMVLVRGN